MDERIKRIFQRHMRRMGAASDNIDGIKFKDFSGAAAYAMCELTELYSEVRGISYDAAAAELHGGECVD